MPRPGPSFLPLLKEVSRSFYLTLRILPGPVRAQIGLAYLLARATDTIADTDAVPLEQRLRALDMLREAIEGGTVPLEFGELGRKQTSPGERRLLEQADMAVAALQEFSPADQERIRRVLRTITSGQALDLTRFGGATEGGIIALGNDAELADYTYRVAGCVGEFWSAMCLAHLFPEASWDREQWLSDGVRFGQGLQLVNILRDIPADLRKGRCYLPEDRLATVGLRPEALLDPGAHARLRPLYEAYLAMAHDHLAAGWRYTLALPRSAMRLRLACAWPLLFGVQTLGRLASRNPLDPAERIRISRSAVRGIIWRTLWRYPFPKRWARLFEEAGRAGGLPP